MLFLFFPLGGETSAFNQIERDLTNDKSLFSSPHPRKPTSPFLVSFLFFYLPCDVNPCCCCLVLRLCFFPLIFVRAH